MSFLLHLKYRNSFVGYVIAIIIFTGCRNSQDVGMQSFPTFTHSSGEMPESVVEGIEEQFYPYATTPSPSPTVLSASNTPSITPSSSVTPSITPTSSVTPPNTPTSSVTPLSTPSTSPSAANTPPSTNSGTGSASVSSSMTPSPSAPISYNLAMGLGSNSACFLKSDNNLIYCLGDNTYGQLAESTATSNSFTLVQTQANQYSSIFGNYYTFCGYQTSAQNIYCWGNLYNDPGATTQVATSTPQNINPTCSSGDISPSMPTPPLGVAIGSLHICMILPGVNTCWSNWVSGGGTVTSPVVCWGDNSEGQLGLGDGVVLSSYYITGAAPSANAQSPQYPVVTCSDSTCTGNSYSVIQNIAYITAGQYHTCAASDQGSNYNIYCWGSNTYGQLGVNGNGFTSGNNYNVAASVMPTTTHTIALAAGNSHTCLLDGGTLSCWGYNELAQAGQTPSSPYIISTPTQVDSSFFPAADTTLVTLGQFGPSDTTCALDSNNYAWCFGSDANNQLNDGINNAVASGSYQVTANVISYYPYDYSVDGQGTTDAIPVQYITSGSYFMCAINIYQAAYCWGQDDSGQVGLSPSSPSLTGSGGDVCLIGTNELPFQPN
jgi:alpha-tubulin suppressor-like RCC1 family protein